MAIDTLLRQLANELGLAELSLDHTNTCAIGLPDDLHIDLHHEPQAGALCLAADLLELQDDTRAQIVPALLRANLDLGALGGAWFARRERTVSLCRSLPVDGLDLPALAQALAGLVAQCRRWRAHLAASPAAPA